MILIVCVFINSVLGRSLQTQPQICPYGYYQKDPQINQTSITCIQCPSTCPYCLEFKFDQDPCQQCSYGMYFSDNNLSCLISPNISNTSLQKQCQQALSNKNQTSNDSNSATTRNNDSKLNDEESPDLQLCQQINHQCSSKCKVCLNFNGCLECKEGYKKQGWKCVQKTNIYFEMEVEVEGVDKQRIKNVFRGAVDEFRKQFKRMIKNGYEDLSNDEYLTIGSANVKQDANTVILKGTIDNVFNKEIINLTQSIEDQVCLLAFTDYLSIGGFALRSFAFFPQTVEQLNGMQIERKGKQASRTCEKVTYEETLALVIIGIVLTMGRYQLIQDYY